MSYGVQDDLRVRVLDLVSHLDLFAHPDSVTDPFSVWHAVPDLYH